VLYSLRLLGLFLTGISYINTAIAAGAVAILCNEFPSDRKEDVLYLQVSDTAKALALAAHRFYEAPSERLCWLELQEQMARQRLPPCCLSYSGH
jgi:UDP-N-acetylmuramyl tripeptide synthase